MENEDRAQDIQDAINITSIERGPRIEELERLARESHDAIIAIQGRVRAITDELKGVDRDACTATQLADKSHDQLIELGVKLEYITKKQDTVILRLDGIDASQDALLGKVAGLSLNAATAKAEDRSFVQKNINAVLTLLVGGLVTTVLVILWYAIH